MNYVMWMFVKFEVTNEPNRLNQGKTGLNDRPTLTLTLRLVGCKVYSKVMPMYFMLFLLIVAAQSFMSSACGFPRSCSLVSALSLCVCVPAFCPHPDVISD